MNIRPALAADAGALARLHGASFAAPWTADDIAALIGAPGAVAFLGEAEAPFAFVLMRAIAGEAEVLTLAVEPGRRRTGAARALMRAGEAQARAQGAEAVFLEVAVDNAAALALYSSLGFETAGRRPGYYARPGGPVDALLLRRPLNTPDE